MKRILTALLVPALFSGTACFAQDTLVSVNEPVTATATPAPDLKKQPVYKFNYAVDIPVTAVTTGITLYGFSKIYNKERLTVAEVESLDPRTVNRFDRSATRQFNESASKIGDYLFYGSMPLPLLFLADNKIRKDYLKIMLLYLETMGATGVLYTSAVYFGDRYRPYTYNDEAPMDFKLRGGSRNSFFAGHPALVGTSTFFMASVYAAYHPESKIKWVFYTVAGLATATTAMARYLGGRHFPSDILIGITVGPLAGILIPHIHKNKDLSKRKTVVTPFFGQSSGLALVHKF
ncbi:MAG: phosphatase PAP2 family protein [Chitinophagaceae bacterium]